MTDPTITIAGLEARINSLRSAVQHSNRTAAERMTMFVEASSNADRLTAERDALAAQLAEVRAELVQLGGADLARDAAEDRAARLDADLAKVRAELAACQTRIAGLEQAANERSAEVARLTARVAELEARPVLTEERLRGALFACADGASDAEVRAILAALGPVTLPAQDRAEELVSAWRGICTDSATCDLDPAERMRRALASLGAPPTSPPAARPVFAGVSMDDLVSAYMDDKCRDHKKGGAEMCCIDSGIRAVLARLEVSLVAPVDPEAVAREYHASGALPDVPSWTEISSFGRHIATQAMRTALRASGIPVTPEVDK